MPNFAQTIIVGHTGKDPETRYLPSGDAVANFSVAVTETWKDKASGDKKESVTWYRVNAFGKLAEIISQYVKKGTPVMVAGKMQARKWTDKDGIERESWELRADTMQLLGSKEHSDSQYAPQSAAPQQRAPQAPASSSGGAFDDFSSDIPF